MTGRFSERVRFTRMLLDLLQSRPHGQEVIEQLMQGLLIQVLLAPDPKMEEHPLRTGDQVVLLHHAFHGGRHRGTGDLPEILGSLNGLVLAGLEVDVNGHDRNGCDDSSIQFTCQKPKSDRRSEERRAPCKEGKCCIPLRPVHRPRGCECSRKKAP